MWKNVLTGEEKEKNQGYIPIARVIHPNWVFVFHSSAEVQCQIVYHLQEKREKHSKLLVLKVFKNF